MIEVHRRSSLSIQFNSAITFLKNTQKYAVTAILTNKFRCIWWWMTVIWQEEKYLQILIVIQDSPRIFCESIKLYISTDVTMFSNTAVKQFNDDLQVMTQLSEQTFSSEHGPEHIQQPDVVSTDTTISSTLRPCIMFTTRIKNHLN